MYTETSDANATYGLYMEMARSGVMKKSAMDVNIINKDAVQKLLSVSWTLLLYEIAMNWIRKFGFAIPLPCFCFILSIVDLHLITHPLSIYGKTVINTLKQFLRKNISLTVCKEICWFW